MWLKRRCLERLGYLTGLVLDVEICRAGKLSWEGSRIPGQDDLRMVGGKS